MMYGSLLRPHGKDLLIIYIYHINYITRISGKEIITRMSGTMKYWVCSSIYNII